METVSYWIIQYGYSGIFVLLTLGILGIPAPDEIILLFSGFLVFQDKLNAVAVSIVAFSGAVCGISLSYFLGKIFGMIAIQKYGYIFHIDSRKLDGVRSWLNRRGKWAFIVGFYLPGFRHAMAYGSGIIGFPFYQFIAYTSAGGFIWTISFIITGYILGKEIPVISDRIHYHIRLVSATVLIVLVLYVIIKIMLKSKNNSLKENQNTSVI